MVKNKLKGSLWSYNVDKISLKRDKKLIIENVLNHGTDEERIKLFEKVEWKNVKGYIKKEVKKFIENKKDFDRYE